VITYLMGSIFAAIIGVSLVVWLAVLARGAIRHQRELHRQRNEIPSQKALEDFIRHVDQATSGEELNRLENKREDD